MIETTWIIGAGSGIGHALALELSRRGADLVLSSRDRDKLEALVRDTGRPHVVAPLDIVDADAVAAVWRDRRIDSVIVTAGDYEPMALDALDLARCRAIVETNLLGALNVIHAVLPGMKARRSGRIALCASVAGYRGLPNGQPYSSSKAGLINLAESLRAECRGTGVDIRLISPGFVRTPMTDKNDFRMPMMIEPEAAARSIADGLARRAFEIHFPRPFTDAMKILRILPAWLYFRLVSR